MMSAAVHFPKRQRVVAVWQAQTKTKNYKNKRHKQINKGRTNSGKEKDDTESSLRTFDLFSVCWFGSVFTTSRRSVSRLYLDD